MMKKFLTAAVLALGLSTIGAPAALAHGGAQSKHGGIVQTASELTFELVAQPDGAVIYVEDHGKPMSTSGMAGRLTVLNGTEKTEAALSAASDRLEAKGVRIAKGAKVVAALTTAGKKAITVRFAVR